ncbi:gamma-tubulin complex component 4 [Tanacetum coccineum]
MQLVVVRADLNEHLKAIRDYFLLEKGDFFQESRQLMRLPPRQSTAEAGLVVHSGWNDRSNAVEILVNKLKIFSSFNKYLFKKVTQLITLDNFREHQELSRYGDMITAQHTLQSDLIELPQENPLIVLGPRYDKEQISYEE